jgi:uncharacterized protein YbjT (DUF2867 family)
MGGALTVLVAGATGLVGQQALRQLLADPAVGEVRALVRRELSAEQVLGQADAAALSTAQRAKLRVCVANFNRLEAHVDWFAVDWVFCALGTTIRQAGSQEAFRQLDFDVVLQVAQLAHAQHVRCFMLVSALGADAGSKIFYNCVKGELEEAVSAIGFPQLCIAQPSLLAGNRQAFRPGERISLWLAKLAGPLVPAIYRPVHAAQVAAGLIAGAKAGRAGRHILNNIKLRAMR